MILRCTKKLLDVIRPKQLTTAEPGDDDWYANLLVFNRRKCLLLTHAGTLFTIFKPDLRASDLRSTLPLIAGLIERQLAAEELPLGTFGDLDSEPLLIAKTANRRVLGCMNDMAFLCEVTVADSGGLADVDIVALNHHCSATSTAFGTTSDQSISRRNGPAYRRWSLAANHCPQIPTSSPLSACMLS